MPSPQLAWTPSAMLSWFSEWTCSISEYRLAGVEPVISASRMLDSASRYEPKVESATFACLEPARFSRLTEMVSGERGNTIWVNRPVRTESALTIAPVYIESEFAAYATMRSNCWVSVVCTVVHWESPLVAGADGV